MLVPSSTIDWCSSAFTLLLQNRFAALEDLLDVGTQLARLRIDQLEFLLDAEGKDMIIHAAN